jgi:Mg2+/Co2+ transporter CorB
MRLAQEFSQLASELKKLQDVKKIKQQLQQTNHVAVRCTEFKDGEAIDEIIRILSLPEALKILEEEPEKNQKQKNLWALDGYDVPTSQQLRSTG